MQPFLTVAREGDHVGTWGTSLYANDLTSDIRGDYVDGLKRGKTNEEITRELIDGIQRILARMRNPYSGLPWRIRSGTTEGCFRT